MRKIKRKATIGIIANTLTLEHRAVVIKNIGEPNNVDFFKPLEFTFKSVTGSIISGQVILLDVLSDEVSTTAGFAKGQKILRSAVEYLNSIGIKIIAFTSATKRLEGRNGDWIKNKYPNITFTIGDNCTLLSCLRLIDKYINMTARTDKIVVMGMGILGSAIIDYIFSKGYENIQVLSEKAIGLPKQIKVTNNFKEIGQDIKLLICCTHKHRDILDDKLFAKALVKTATIIDVAVPQGIGPRLYNNLIKSVIRLDAGDYFLKRLKYNFNPHLLQFPAVGFWYGCFTEAITLGLILKDIESLTGYNFFQVNPKNMELIDFYLKLENKAVKIPLINFLNKKQAIKYMDY